MDNVIKTLEHKGFKINIESCDWAESPREWDNAGKMVCEHRNYELGDEQYKNSYANNWREWFAYYVLENHVTMNLPSYDTYGYFDDKGKELDRVWKWIENNMIVFKLSLYDHSGITISHVSVDYQGGGWDSGIVGFHYITKEDAIKEFGNKKFTQKVKEKAEACLEAELDIYDKYIMGEVYGYEVVDQHGNHIDSCGGYYGYDEEKSGLLEAAIDSIETRLQVTLVEHIANLKKWIKSKVPFQYRESLNLI